MSMTPRMELAWVKTDNVACYEHEVFGPDPQLKDFLNALVEMACDELNDRTATAIHFQLNILRPPIKKTDDEGV